MNERVTELIQLAIADIDFRISIHQANVQTYVSELRTESLILDDLMQTRQSYASALPAENSDA